MARVCAGSAYMVLKHSNTLQCVLVMYKRQMQLNINKSGLHGLEWKTRDPYSLVNDSLVTRTHCTLFPSSRSSRSDPHHPPTKAIQGGSTIVHSTSERPVSRSSRGLLAANQLPWPESRVVASPIENIECSGPVPEWDRQSGLADCGRMNTCLFYCNRASNDTRLGIK